MRLIVLLSLFFTVVTVHASSHRVPLVPDSNRIDQTEAFVRIERLTQPAGLCRVRIVLPTTSQELPIHSISLVLGQRDNPDMSLDLAVSLGISDSAETTFELSEELLKKACVSAHYANYGRSSAAVLYEIPLKMWIKKE